MSALQSLADDTRLFNSLKMPNEVTDAHYAQQFKIMMSEVKELFDAMRDGNKLEMLDGAIDSLVTLLGFIQLMEKQGYNVDRAMRKVGENNLTKFIPTIEEAIQEGAKWNLFHDEDEMCSLVQDVDQKWWALVDKQGKIRKPSTYKSVDLSDCLPKE